MSLAGIRSNRGDGYQTLVAFDWALLVLSDPDYQWLEVDSIDYPVDDVVVGKRDGSLICCQCKKNQPNFNSWSVADLADELEKAARLLVDTPNAQVRFYSRSPFGTLAKLREYCTTQPDEAHYQAGFTQEYRQIDAALLQLLPDTMSSYAFLSHIIFETTEELGRMQDLLNERLRNIACKQGVAFNILWTHLDHLGARMEDGGGSSVSVRHRLTKEEIREILTNAGVMLAPPVDIAKVRDEFAGTSAVGRAWERNIAEHHISNPVLQELLAAIAEKKHTILLTGQPGSGKTCVLLDLQEELETQARGRDDIVPLFIQSREFADISTVLERQAQGLSEDWVEKAARLADNAHVVVVIDSLDVLSIAREHSVLTYFLSQMDRLMQVPNITIVTACREFDRHYDRRIAVRKWDCELVCRPFVWDAQVAPLLEGLGIDISQIDSATRELIQNPRELALFVELARRQGGFSIVTSQALAQRYLDIAVRSEPGLGEPAMAAIEAMADEMLKKRTLSIPVQHFKGSHQVYRKLLSQNVLHETDDGGKLTFGHQTLIDVLAIRGAIRQGQTLYDFIQSLPPVPFIRPSVRSFIVQLAAENRKEFRKQLRPVLTGDMAFHIRRLVAESFVESPPQDADWSLIYDLYKNHHEVFQVIYQRASGIEWHYFWLKYLVPLLKESKNAEELASHAYLISQWKNLDPVGVFDFWCEVLSLDWMDKNRIALQLSMYTSDIAEENLSLFVPVLRILLKFPRQEHSLLGKVIVHCVKAGVICDDVLWHYVAGDIKEEDAVGLSIGDKIHCEQYDFGNDENFFANRMRESTTLLDMALASIEQWSQLRIQKYKITRINYWEGFLRETFYEKDHTQQEIYYVDGMHILLAAIEASIIKHAQNNSPWWLKNRECLCRSPEASLRYFAILACIASPQNDLDQIGRMLCDKGMLESDLSYELGELIHDTFIYLNKSQQYRVVTTIFTIYADEENSNNHNWVLRKRAELISAIPCYLRSPEAQALLDDYEAISGPMIRQPEIVSAGGFVAPPFSYTVFLNIDDIGFLKLLKHYEGYSGSFGDEFLIGGEEQVGGELREAASRHPLRFISLLADHFWDIGNTFRDHIMDGLAHYLAYRYGNLRPDKNWEPVVAPDGIVLADLIIDELERHPVYWFHNRGASNAINACANVIEDTKTADRLVFLALGFITMWEDNPIHDDLLTQGINMTRGHVAEGMMILANRFLEKNLPWPELLAPALCRFAGDDHPAIRALILQRLPYLQYRLPELGWAMFDRAMHDSKKLWNIAELCLYYSYRKNFERIAPVLKKLRQEGKDANLETWGRISALAVLSGHIGITDLLQDLQSLDSSQAWEGAASVWTHPKNIEQFRELCLKGLEAGLHSQQAYAWAVAQKMEGIFRIESPFITIPTDLLKNYFETLGRNDTEKQNRLFIFPEWLNRYVQQCPEEALTAAELYLEYTKKTHSFLSNYHDNLTQFLTRLFDEAEEREESDHGELLKRVVALQDNMLSLGVYDIEKWLRAAERP
jgi:hypothetical protein